MVLIDPRIGLVLACERADQLREEATAAPRRTSTARRVLAASLRGAADRLDRAPLVHRTA